MSALLFGDLYKPVKKVLGDNYKPDQSSYTIKTKQADDLEIEVGGNKKGAAIDGTLSWKQIFKKEKAKYTVNGKVDVAGTVTTSVEAEGLKEGLKVKVGSELFAVQPKCGKKGDNGSVNVEYKQEKFTVTAELKKQVKAPLQLSVTGVVSPLKGLHLGASAKLAAVPKACCKKQECCKKEETPAAEEKKEETPAAATAPEEKKEEKKVEKKPLPAKVENYDLALRYDYDTLSIYASLEESMKKGKFAFAIQPKKDVTISGEFVHVLKAEEKKCEKKCGGEEKKAEEKKPEEKKCQSQCQKPCAGKKPSTFTVGVAKKIDDNSSVQIKANTDGSASAAYTIKLQNDLEAIASLESNICELNSNSKFGIALTYSPSNKQ